MSKFANFVAGALQSSVGPESTSIGVFVPPGRNPPPDPGGEIARLVLIDDPRRPEKFEIIQYTGVSAGLSSAIGSTGSVVQLEGVARGADGTQAGSWLAGAFIAQDVPAGLIQALGVAANPGDTASLGEDGQLIIRPVDAAGLVEPGLLSGPVLLAGLINAPTPPAEGFAVFYERINGVSERILALDQKGKTTVLADKAGSVAA